MKTANSTMRETWLNVLSSNSGNMTININHLYQLLLELERDQYEKGYKDGWQHHIDTLADKTPIKNDFSNVKVKWTNEMFK